MTEKMVCLAHGKPHSEHEHGRCLYCCLCFEQLSYETCSTDEDGQKQDICEPCWQAEKLVMGRLGDGE